MATSFFNIFILFVNFIINGKVINVVDGDTVYIITANNVTYKIRLENIDAPEKTQPYSSNSKQYLHKKIKGKQVTCNLTKKDRYGRWLGTIYYNEININVDLVSTGNAWAYLYNKNVAIKNAQIEAQKLKIGLWSLPSPIAPWLYRKHRRAY